MCKTKMYLLFLIACFFIECTSESNEVCYSFNQKQCQVDPWTKEGDENSLSDRVRAYLQVEGIDVKKITVEVLDGITCLACGVCPDGTKINISIGEEDVPKLETLDLLSLNEEISCN